ncbi:hypothetical protein [uncultured Chryseobacterium sp.]|uniref:DUF7336 domain-containing protein n=1 Tax=uncultured Chryseobacterium sp. TaxID=259322 RepID=UPI0025CBF09B|nr:hypothetical protein [uncultured Chryseobacterium sp.]
MKYFLYTLEHIYTDESHTACKLLGFFDDLEKLEQVKSFASELSGFKNYPKGFVITKYEVDKRHWEYGFNSVVGEIGRDYLTEGDIIDETYLSVQELGLESVFSVSHSYTIHRYLDDERMIGVFSSKEKAEQAVEELKTKEGFILHPDDFDISELDLNDLLWKSGF